MLPVLKTNNLKVDKEFFVNPYFSVIVRKIQEEDFNVLVLTQLVHERMILSFNEFCEENEIELIPNQFGFTLKISKNFNLDLINQFFQDLIKQFISNYGFYI